MSGLSNNAKFFCVAGGMVAAILVAGVLRMTTPVTAFVEEAESYPRFDAAKEQEWREHEQTAIINWLVKSSTESLCANNRRYARSAVLSYFRQRARSIVIAEHFLPANEADQVKGQWDGQAGRAAESAVIDAVQKGLIYRSDFKPILPELAAIFDKAAAVQPVCDS
jgi:hypothetical protein